ncbi:MAG: SPOR domain-containing protein [Acidobacteriia bacterium]|nr:SPOR domain-containing protein [Terriglobia bacterium]
MNANVITDEFSLDRKAAITLGVGSLLLIISAFTAGLLTGLIWSDQQQVPLAKSAAPVKTEAAAEGLPNLTSAAAQQKLMTVPPSNPSLKEAATTMSRSAERPGPDTPGVRLAVRLGAFLERAEAEKLVERLKEEGYAPRIVVSGPSAHQWNWVRIGPYLDWDEASQIAAVLSRGQATPAVVEPIP